MKASLKKVLSMVLVVAMVAAISVAGTMAYLTMDAGAEKNVFSIGDINVSLKEDVDIYGEGGEVKTTDGGAEYTEIMPGDYLKKEVSVTNNGKTDAYVAVTVDVNNFSQIRKEIEAYGEDNDAAEAMLDFVFDGWGMTVRDRYVGEKRDMSYKINELVDSHILHVDSAKRIVANDVAHFSIENWFKSDAEKASSGYTVAGVGNSYYLGEKEDYSLCYTYYIYLPAGESATLFKGLNVPAEFTREQMAMFDGLKITATAKAIQADNMAIAEQYAGDANGKAKTAFAILAGDIETPEYSSKPSGRMGGVYTTTDRIWGEHSSNAKTSHVIKIYSGDTYMGETSLKNIDNIIDGDVTVTWHIKLDAAQGSDYWDMSWTNAPSVNLQPTRAELWVDGVKVDESNVQMNGPDNLNKITAAVIGADGKILRYVVAGTSAELGEGESLMSFISSEAEMAAAIENGATVLNLAPGTYKIPAAAKGKTLTINGTKDTIIVMNTETDNYDASDYNLDGSTVTFNGITHQAATSGSAQGYARATLTFNDCDLKGYMDLPETGVSRFNNCTFDVSGDLYCIWTWGSDKVYFENCTFNTDGKAILVYNSACDVYVDNCTFNDRTNGTGFTKSAIETGCDYGFKNYNIYINKTTVNGFAENDKCVGYKNIVGNKNKMTSDYLNIVVDGEDVY